MKYIHSTLFIFALLLAGLYAGCGGGGSDTSGDDDDAGATDDDDAGTTDDDAGAKDDDAAAADEDTADDDAADDDAADDDTADDDAADDDTADDDAADDDTVDDDAADDDTVDDDAAGDEPVEVTEPVSWIADVDRTPIETHMTWQGETATTIMIQWRTVDTDTKTYLPQVWFVKAADAVVDGETVRMPYAAAFTASGSGFKYNEVGLGGAPVDRRTFYSQWEVELTGLEPATKYYYRCGTWDEFDAAAQSFVNASLSDVHSFTTPPAKSRDAAFNFMLSGDSRGGYEAITQNIERLRDMQAGFWLFSGDMNEVGSRPQWNSWFDAMAPVLSNFVFMPVQGNHEIFAQQNYYDQFALPRNAGLPEEMQEHAWSIDVGNLHIIGLDSNTEPTIQKQLEWLEADLTAARNDPAIVWVAAIFHHGTYSASKHGSTPEVQANWVPLFDRYQVDIVMNGHDHNYERSYPLRADAVAGDGQGTTYVVAGGFFAPPYGNGSDWWTATSTHGDKGNYVWFDVTASSLAGTAYSGDGKEIIDQFTLTK